MPNDKVKNKLLIALLSIIITAIAVGLFFIDESLPWNLYKVVSCTIVGLWMFFIIPALRKSYLLNADKSLAEWFKMGMSFGAGGIAYPILLAPYFGVKYYLN